MRHEYDGALPAFRQEKYEHNRHGKARRHSALYSAHGEQRDRQQHVAQREQHKPGAEFMFFIDIAKHEQRGREDDNTHEYENEDSATAHEQARYDGENTDGYADSAYHIRGTRLQRQAVREYISIYQALYPTHVHLL
jgi:hypothetical protein